MAFDRLGVFTYSVEDGTTAVPLNDPIPEEEKRLRQARLMGLQAEISYEKNLRKIGTLQKTLVERSEDGMYIGRTAADAPEVDAEIRFTSSDDIATGSFVNVKVTEAEDFDLVGVAA